MFLLEKVLYSEYIPLVFIILAFLFLIWIFSGVLKGAGILNSILLIFIFLILCIQFWVFTEVSLDKQYQELTLFFCSIIAVPILIALFSKRESITNEDFVVFIGIAILFQTIISMLVSSGSDYHINIRFIHGAWYISLPAFLIYEISSNKKDFDKINRELEYIKNHINLLPSKNLPKQKKHKCFFKKY